MVGYQIFQQSTQQRYQSLYAQTSRRIPLSPYSQGGRVEQGGKALDSGAPKQLPCPLMYLL